MILVPLGLMAAALTLAQARKLTDAEGGVMGLALPLVFAGALLWLLGSIFMSVDLLALAAETKAGLLAFDARHTAINTSVFAMLGLALGFAGAGAAAGGALLADPDAPMPSLFLPVLAALAGLALLLLAHSRL